MDVYFHAIFGDHLESRLQCWVVQGKDILNCSILYMVIAEVEGKKKIVFLG